MSHDDDDAVVVYVTCPADNAVELAKALVEAGVVACANIVPSVRSIYRWQGKLCDEEEALLIVKTRAARFEALRQRVVELHPYEVPEVIALPIVAGHGPYLAWLRASTEG